MKKVNGTARYSVEVICPECGNEWDAANDEGGDSDEDVRTAMFTNTMDSCTNMNIELICSKCECEFILDEIEY